MAQIIQTTFQFKRGDAERWNELNPILAEGEPGFELDTNKFKIGNGINTWKELPYKGEGNIVNAQTHNDFPTYGNENAIYKAQEEKLLYQWNPNTSEYEVLGTFEETGNGNLITVDTELSASSMNPVANKVITIALQDFAEDHYTKQEVDTAIENTNKRIDLLEGTTHFRGIYPNLNDENLNSDLYEFSAGDIFIVGNSEYICTTNGNLALLEKANYEKLGDVTAEVERISALEEKVGNEESGDMEATGLYQVIAGLENNKLDKTALNNYYSKDETYATTEIDSLLQEIDNREEVTTLRGLVDTIIGDDVGLSMRTVAVAVVAEIVGKAPEAFDTLEEIAAWIEAHPNDVAAITKRISDLETSVSTKIDKTDIINTLDSTALDKPLSAAMGKELNSLIEELSTDVSGKVTEAQVTTAISNALKAYPTTTVMQNAISTALEDKVNVADIINNLTTDNAKKPLSAAQGVALKVLVDDLTTTVSGKQTAEQVTTAINTALTGYLTTTTGDQRYANKGTTETALTEHGDKIAELEEALASSMVEFAESIEWLEANGDKERTYYLPDGYEYVWMTKYVEEIHNASHEEVNYAHSASANLSASLVYKPGVVTFTIPVDGTVVSKDAIDREDSAVKISGLIELVPSVDNNIMRVTWYNASGGIIMSKTQADLNSLAVNGVAVDINAGQSASMPITFNLCDPAHFLESNWKNVRNVRISIGISTADITDADIENLVVNMKTYNFEGEKEGWFSTGIKHSNDEAIAELQDRVSVVEETLANLPSGGSGESVYDFAVEGGYTGTEDDLKKQLAIEIKYDDGNLFNKAEATEGYYLSGSGTLSADAASAVTGFIDVKPNTTYIRTLGATSYPIHEYDSGQTRKRTISGNPFTTSADCEFIRTTIAIKQTPIDTYMVCEGTSLPSGYLPYGPSLRIAGKNVALDTANSNLPLFSKLGVLGDSLSNQEKWQPTTCAVANITEWHKNAITGSCVANYGDPPKTPFVDRYLETPEDCDCITIMGGTNDANTKYGEEEYMGEVGVLNNGTFKGAYSTIIEGLLARKSSVRILLITPPRSYTANNVLNEYIKPYADATKEVAEYYGLPCLDLYNNLGINDKTYTYMLYDNVHFSEEGGLRLGRMIGNFIRNNY